jgi:hypothetical protein
LDITIEDDIVGEQSKVIKPPEQILDALFVDAGLAHLVGIGGGRPEYYEAISVKDELR